MTKLLLIAAFVVGVVFWLKYLAGGRRVEDKARKPPEAEDMVRCHICGVNLPRSEALLSKGRTYCCDEHRRRDA